MSQTITSSIFDTLNNQPVKKFTLKNQNLSVSILNLGATVISLIVKDKNGNDVDVVLGYNSVSEYLTYDGYLGATVGRVCNRIDKGEFVLNGKKYAVGKNDNGNSLHGGINGFDKKIWHDKITDNGLELSYFSPDGEEGYPANLWVTVTFSLTEKGLKIDYVATTDECTIVNLTNHSYFNLNGESNGSILDNVISIDADNITPVNKSLIPNGELMPVKNTPFDFNVAKPIGQDINEKHIQLEYCDGYDINYALNGVGFRKIATAESIITGIKMEVYSDSKGLQLYSGNFLNGALGKSRTKYQKRSGFCLETQNYPNAINCPNFPSPILNEGQTFRTTTEYRFVK